MFEEEARAFGYVMNQGLLDVFIPPSLNKYEYSDTFRGDNEDDGKIGKFNTYQQLKVVTFEKSKT